MLCNKRVKMWVRKCALVEACRPAVDISGGKVDVGVDVDVLILMTLLFVKDVKVAKNSKS